MGLMMGFLGGVGKGVADVSKIYLDKEAEVDKAERIAEAASRIKMRDEETIRDRNKADAATERARIDTDATAIAAKRAGGLMVPEAIASYEATRATDPVGAQAGIDALKSAHAPTIQDRLLAKGDLSAVAADMRAERTADDARTDKSADNLRADKELALREKQFGQASQLSALQIKNAQLTYDRAVEEAKVPAAVSKTFDAAKAEALALMKIEATAGFDATSEGGQKVVKRQAALADQMTRLMDPYLPDKVKAPASGGGSKYNSDTGEVTVDGKVIATVPKGLKSREEIQAALAKTNPAGKDTANTSDKETVSTEQPRGILAKARAAEPGREKAVAESLRVTVEAKLRLKTPLNSREADAAKILGLTN